MSPIVLTYAAYTVISLSLTVWVGRTLHKNGRRFLVDVFKGDAELADSVNHLLVVGFYLINFGFVAFALKLGAPVLDSRQAIEALSAKLGQVSLILGGMHFFNLWIFSKIRRRTTLPNARPPVTHTSTVAVS